MTFFDAKDYCLLRGGPPTAKQLALALHPKGVSDTPREGSYKVQLLYKRPFYYTNDGYLSPGGEENDHQIWSASVYPDLEAYVFNLEKGYLYLTYRYEQNAVRCVGK